MRLFRVFIATTLAAGALAVFVPDANASVPAVSAKVKKFCKAANKISVDSTGSNADDTEQLATNIRKTAKLAPTTRLKSSMKKMAVYFDALADAGNDPSDLADLGDEAGDYAKAAAVFTGYLISNCSFQ
jgi:hypothetical protein